MPPECPIFGLRFPTELAAGQVTAFLAALARLPRHAQLSVETWVSDGRIAHQLVVAPALEDAVLTQLRAHLPRVRVEAAPDAAVPVSRASVLLLRGQERSLDTTLETTATGLLGLLSGLRWHEAAVVQWLVRGRRQPGPADAPAGVGATLLGDLLGRPRLPDAAERKRRQEKRAFVWLAVQGRVAVAAASPARAAQIEARLLAALSAPLPPGARLRLRQMPTRRAADVVQARQWLTWRGPLTLNAGELAVLLGWPTKAPALPGLRTGASRTLPAPRGGGSLTVARSNYADDRREIRLRVRDRLQHVHVLAATGAGKSTLLVNTVLSDAVDGRGLILVDPKGDAVIDVLARLPESRHGDVVILDPADPDYAVGFNVLQGSAGTEGLVVDQVVGTFRSLYASSWGPRTADVMRAGLATLIAAEDDYTLCELPPLLVDPRFRRRVLQGVSMRPELAGFWSWFANLSEAERATVTAPVLNKLRSVTMRDSLRRTFGQTHGLNLDAVLEEGRILLVPLRSGMLGPEATSLLGSLLVAGLWQAISRRSGRAAAGRRAVMVVLDEAQLLVKTPVDLGHALAQARGLGVGFCLSHQHLKQLDPDLRAAVLANCRNKLVFALSHDDARVMAREFQPDLDEDDLRGLGPYEIAALLTRDNARVVTTGRTEPLPPAVPGQAERLRRQAMARIGRPVAEVDREQAARVGHRGPASGAVGREERP